MTNRLTCPACQTTQTIVSQFDFANGALVVLDCAHAWELVKPDPSARHVVQHVISDAS